MWLFFLIVIIIPFLFEIFFRNGNKLSIEGKETFRKVYVGIGIFIFSIIVIMALLLFINRNEDL